VPDNRVGLIPAPQIDERYGHLAHDSDAAILARLDARSERSCVDRASTPGAVSNANVAQSRCLYGVQREADDGARTRDPWLGKPMLYQLSYVRVSGANDSTALRSQ
jgi:hypothetical protein